MPDVLLNGKRHRLALRFARGHLLRSRLGLRHDSPLYLNLDHGRGKVPVGKSDLVALDQGVTRLTTE